MTRTSDSQRSVKNAVQEILDDPTAPRERKLRRLRRLEHDLAQRSTATEEGMGGGPAPEVGQVRQARRLLRDPELDDARQPRTR